MTCAIVGIGRTAYSRNSGRTTLGMATEACRAALDDAGVEADAVDGMVTYHANDSAGAPGGGWGVGGGGGGGCHAVLVYRSLNGRSGHRFGTVSGPMAVEHEWQFCAPHGFLVPPQW